MEVRWAPGEGHVLGLSRLLEELRHGEDSESEGSGELRVGSLGTIEGLREGTGLLPAHSESTALMCRLVENMPEWRWVALGLDWSQDESLRLNPSGREGWLPWSSSRPGLQQEEEGREEANSPSTTCPVPSVHVSGLPERRPVLACGPTWSGAGFAIPGGLPGALRDRGRETAWASESRRLQPGKGDVKRLPV